MSSVKRYEVNGSSPFYEDEKGSFVDYEDYAALEAKCGALAAENAGLKSAHPQPFGPEMMKALDAYEKHQGEVPETGMLDAFFILRDSIRVKTPVTDCVNGEGVAIDENECRKALCAENAKLKEFISLECMVFGDNNNLLVAESFIPETPTTDAILAEVRAQGVTEYATKRGFSFQHGSIHAHFGNGDVMVGATKFENGHAGICFAPVREKEGGVGTEYKWTEGKNTEQVDSVFVISSSNIEGLEVIQGKLSEAITQLRREAAQ